MRERFRRLRREERGSVLPIVAALMLAMLGMAALVIDISNLYQIRRQAQSAADAAALAAVQDLPGNSGTAQTDAQSYVSKNISGATATVTTPYKGSSSQIQVTVSTTVPSIFANVLGISQVTVSASAAAKRSVSPVASALFASDTTCSNRGIFINSGVTIAGGLHSNGTFYNDGNHASFGTVTYGGPNGCSLTDLGNGTTYSGGSATRDPSTEPWPYDYSQNTPACTFGSLASSTPFTFSSGAIPPGVYCTTGLITMNGNGMTGNGVTFIAGSFSLGGSGTLTPAAGANNLLFYQTGSSTMTLNGNNFGALGTIFAPNATVVLNGNSGSVNGFVEAQDITVNANGMSFTGTGPGLASGSGGALFE